MDEAFESAKVAQKEWARTPLWKRAEMMHKVGREREGEGGGAMRRGVSCYKYAVWRRLVGVFFFGLMPPTATFVVEATTCLSKLASVHSAEMRVG